MMMGTTREEDYHHVEDDNNVNYERLNFRSRDKMKCLSTRDMDGQGVVLVPGDQLHVDNTQEQANAIYIGSGMSVCVRGNLVVKERLWNTRFKKSQINGCMDVYNRGRAVGRAIEKIGQLFTGETDFVTWCCTGV